MVTSGAVKLQRGLDDEVRAVDEEDRALIHALRQCPHPVVIHRQGKICRANIAATELFEVEGEARGLPLSVFITESSTDLVLRRIGGVFDSGKATVGEVRLRTAKGRPLVVETCASRTSWQGQPAVYLVVWDVTARREQADRLSWAANHDALTGLPNRLMLADRLRSDIAGLSAGPGMVAVFFVDLDGYKAINDTFGHIAGDEVLRKIASRLAGSVNPGDLVARYGGDEFVVVCTSPSVRRIEDVRAMACLLQSAVAKPTRLAQSRVEITASVGWATTSDPTCIIGDLLARADEASYEAKRYRRPALSPAAGCVCD